jgi:hypothetical protein
MRIGGVCLPKLGAHPLLLHAELDPEYEEDEDERDKSAHLGEGWPMGLPNVVRPLRVIEELKLRREERYVPAGAFVDSLSGPCSPCQVAVSRINLLLRDPSYSP